MLPFVRIFHYTEPVPDINIEKLSIGFNHRALLYTNGELYTAGNNGTYQLGTGTNVTNYKWAKVQEDVKMVWCGFQNTLIYKNDGTWWYIGDKSALTGSYGTTQTWTNITSTFANIAYDDIKKLDLGLYCMVILKNDNTLYGMGYNGMGELGQGNNVAVTAPKLLTTTPIKDVSLRGASMFIINTSNEVWRCGRNNTGQLGNGGSNNLVNAGLSLLAAIDGYTPVQVFATSTNTYIKYRNDVTGELVGYSTGANVNGETGRLPRGSNLVSFGQMTGVTGSDSVAFEFPREGFNSSALVFKNNNTLYGMGANSNGACAATSNDSTYCSPPVACNEVPNVDINKIKYIGTLDASMLTLCVYENKVYWAGNATYVGLPSAINNFFTELETPY